MNTLLAAADLDLPNLNLQKAFDFLSSQSGAAGLPADAPAGESLALVILTWLQPLMAIIGVLALIALIVGGIMYILSFGNEDRAKTAKRIVIYAIIGLLVVGASAMIVNLIIFTFWTP